MTIQRNPTREVVIGSVTIGGGHPIVLQSMAATKTYDIDATVATVNMLSSSGAGIVRIAADTKKDARALASIRQETEANLSVDLQENYRLAEEIAPYVNKIRYNPGHLHHFEPQLPWQDKVKYFADIATKHDCAIRIGVNCGSVDPAKQGKFDPEDMVSPMVESALEHAECLDSIGFSRFCVSLKDSNPQHVIEANERFAAAKGDVPLHLGVTEAGVPPDGILKTRAALIPLLTKGIGDTLRVSLTVPNVQKFEEIISGRELLDDIAAGRTDVPDLEAELGRLNIISCPSCSRVENAAFVTLAQQVREATRYAADEPFTIAVMGCRVNGPGETDHADLGLWCGATQVNLKRKSQVVGAYSYEEIIPKLLEYLNRLIEEKEE